MAFGEIFFEHSESNKYIFKKIINQIETVNQR